MYSSRETNAYGQQPYVGQSGYSHSQNLGAGYSGSSVGRPDGGSQMSLSSRHSSILGSSQDAEVGGYRTLPSVSAHYGGQYSSIYGTSALSATQQVPAASSKGTGASALEACNAYATPLSDSPKFASTDYVSSSSLGYSHKGDQMYADKIPDYPTVERRQFGEGHGGYLGRDLPTEPAGRYSDSAIFGHQHQPDIYDRLDQAVLLRQEQLLKAQSVSHDSSSRQADYLAARSAATRHSTQDLLPYGGRMDTDPRISSLLSSSSYDGQTPSILGAAPRRNVDNLMYPPGSSNPGYGVSLPPGRDYGTKRLHVTTLESEYPGNTLSRSGHTRIDERKDDRAGYLREFEMREEERRRDNLREREKDREREQERERQRERERERLRILERREKERELEKERERERKRALEVTRERTSPRVSRDHRGPSLTKEPRPLRRKSQRREVLHRRLSPLKEKRREYVCKVYSSNLTDVERGYLSIDKQYPRLFVSPEFSKVVINWPKENLKLSMHTHVSFEHDYIEDSLAELKELSSKLVCAEPEKPEQGSTVWNAKIILMSGLSRSALEELSSEKVPDDRRPHICNILRFAVLKKDHSFMAIGGPCIYADGSNPTVDEFFLIQTALRYAKDVNLDLKKCQHWNPFLEIHYDRIGKDGLFSHKEVTVLFVPDLSECLPSLDTWRAQWLAHRKAVSERDRQLSLKREKLKERKEGSKDKEADSTKQTEKGKSGKRIQSVSSSHRVVANKTEKDGSCIEGGAVEGKVARGENKVQVKDGGGIAVEGGPEKKESEAPPATAAKTGAVKSVKKKVIKRIVKQKVANKRAAEVNTANKQTNRVEEDAGEQKTKSETAGQQEESSAGSAGMKTFVRKKIIKKEAVGKNDQSEGNGVPLEAKVEVETGCSEDKPKDNSVAAPAAVENTSVKTTIKKKIIKRVPKRKVPATQAKDEVAGIKNEGDEDEKKVVQAGDETSNIGKQTCSEKQGNSASSSKSEIKADKENKKDEKLTNVESPNDKKKVNTKDTCDVKGGKSEGGNPKEGRDSKDEFRSNSSKESKEKRKPEEPSLKHPGLILQTKWSKDSKLRPVSLSLDSLLDYTDKDIEESTFELSLFAEVMYEMLQYQMGCCILTFLQKLRVRFMTKRNQRKRQREEIHDKETEKKLPKKKSKSNELPVKENEFGKANALSEAQQDVEMTVTKEETTADHVEEPKKTEVENNADCVEEPNIKDEIDDEDPEEDPEEYEEMDDPSPQPISSNEKNEEEKAQADAKLLKEVEKDEALASTKSEITTKAACSEPLPEGDMSRKERKVDSKKVYAIDKDLLQAFRFFDRNRVGYIRVEDMRLIIHSLGKFLSHRDVKELVQSALLESNTGRDDHILYDTLVRMSDI